VETITLNPVGAAGTPPPVGVVPLLPPPPPSSQAAKENPIIATMAIIPNAFNTFFIQNSFAFNVRQTKFVYCSISCFFWLF